MSVVREDTEERLPRAVQIALREYERDLDEGRVTPAEYDALVDELLRSLGIPPVRADD